MTMQSCFSFVFSPRAAESPNPWRLVASASGDSVVVEPFVDRTNGQKDSPVFVQLLVLAVVDSAAGVALLLIFCCTVVVFF